MNLSSALPLTSQQVQVALEETHHNLQAIEDDLTHFLDAYYAQVGADFEYLSQLQAELKAVHTGCFDVASTSDDSAAAQAKSTASSQASLKQFYRDMARECHPDGSAANEHEEGLAALKADMMKTLNAAYARKNLSQMWQIKWELERQKNDGTLAHRQRLELLREQQAQMQSTLSELRQREAELKDSAAYQLMQHSRLMQCCGQDFTAMVKGRVQRQIDEAKRDLRAARYQAKYWSNVKMQRANDSV